MGDVKERLLTARKVAELLDVSVETVLRWTRAGKLPAIKLPSGQIRFDGDTLDDWLAERVTSRRGEATQPRRTPPTTTLEAATQPE